MAAAAVVAAESQFQYVATSQKPTAISHCVVGNFTSPTELNHILAKVTRIELHSITPDGLVPVYDVGIYGRIAALALIRLHVSHGRLDTTAIYAQWRRGCCL